MICLAPEVPVKWNDVDVGGARLDRRLALTRDNSSVPSSPLCVSVVVADDSMMSISAGGSNCTADDAPSSVLLWLMSAFVSRRTPAPVPASSVDRCALLSLHRWSSAFSTLRLSVAQLTLSPVCLSLLAFSPFSCVFSASNLGC